VSENFFHWLHARARSVDLFSPSSAKTLVLWYSGIAFYNADPNK